MWETKYLSPARVHRDNLVYNILDDQEEESRVQKDPKDSESTTNMIIIKCS